MDKLYEKYQSSRFGLVNENNKEAFESSLRMYERMYNDKLPLDKNIRILDVGCGMGHFIYYLQKKGFMNFIGIDISPEQIDFCRNNISENVECIDAFAFLEKNFNFDVIVMNDVLEHFNKNKILDLLILIYDRLNKNGILIIKVPNAANPFNISTFYTDFTHETLFTKESLNQILVVSNFKNIKVFECKSNRTTFKGIIGALLEKSIYDIIRFSYILHRHKSVTGILLTPNIMAIAGKS